MSDLKSVEETRSEGNKKCDEAFAHCRGREESNVSEDMNDGAKDEYLWRRIHARVVDSVRAR